MSKLDEIEKKYANDDVQLVLKSLAYKESLEATAIFDALRDIIILIDRCRKLEKVVDAGKAHIETLVQDQESDSGPYDEQKMDEYYKALRELEDSE